MYGTLDDNNKRALAHAVATLINLAQTNYTFKK